MTIKIYGLDGEQYNLYTAATDEPVVRRWPYGTQLEMQDGRAYRFAMAGGTLIVIGDLLQSPANVADDVGRTGIAAALGARSPTLTTGSAVTANEYSEGFFVVSVDPGKGLYAIDNHLAGTTAVAYNLAAGHAIRVAALTTTSRVDLIRNPYKGVIQAPATTPTAAPAGVAVSAIAATTGCGWVQTKGLAAVLTSGSLIIGNRAVASIGAGAVGPQAGAGLAIAEIDIGTVQRVAASGAWSTIRLKGID